MYNFVSAQFLNHVDTMKNIKESFFGLLMVLLTAAAASESLAAQNHDNPEDQVDTLSAVVVSTDRISIPSRSQTGLTRVDRSRIDAGFALFGSPDVIKTLQRLPGVASGTELLSGLYVHGGTGSDNLFLLDGVPLFSTSHLIGLFSSFNSDVVENVDFYKSGFPARYGGRLSSVVDVNTREGDMYEWHGKFSLGLIDGRFQLEGPLVKGKTSVNLGLRRTWMDTFTIPAVMIANKELKKDGETMNAHYAFWDFNFGITHLFSSKDKLQFNFFDGMDKLKGRYKILDSRYDRDTDTRIWYEDRLSDDFDGKLLWGSTNAGLTWTHTFNEDLISRTRAYVALNQSKITYRYDSWYWNEDVGDCYSTAETNESDVSDWCLKSDFDWTPGDRHHVRFGASLQHHFYHPSRNFHSWNINDGKQQEGTKSDVDNEYPAEEAAVYAEDEISIGGRLTLSPGFRYAAFLTDGKLWNAPEPRLSMRYDISDAMAFKMSYAQMNQFVHFLQTVYLDLPTSSWLPCTSKMKPMFAREVAGGFYTRLPHGIILNLEGFWKTMDHLYEYAEGFSLYPPIDKWENSFTEGQGRAYGTELSMEWSNERTFVSVAYTLSWSERFFPEFYHEWYPDRNDSRHMFNLTFTHKVSKSFDFYAGWTCHSGSRVTMALQGVDPEPFTDWRGRETLYYREISTSPYNVALPAYHRMDLGLNFRKIRKNGNERIWNLSCYNAYCRLNPLIGFFSQDNDTGEYVATCYGIIPIVPTFSYILKF